MRRRPHSRDVLEVRRGREPTREVGLEELAQAVDLGQVVDVQLGDPVAAVRDVDDVALALEHAQGLAHRHPADAQ